MNSTDFFTIKDAAEYFNLNINTFRYWLSKNNADCERGIYDTNLYSLLAKVKLLGRNSITNSLRIYERYIILDIEEFKKEFQNYTNFLKENKKRKRKRNLGWSTSAIECYQSNMICKKCINKKVCYSIARKTEDKTPPMKKTVIKLLTELGLPPKI